MADTVILIFPRVEPDQPDPEKLLGFPLAPLVLAPPLQRAGFRVRVIDENVTPRVQDALQGEEAPIYVGFSVIGGWQIRAALALARKLRRRWPRVPFVWGGWSPTLLPELWTQDELAPWVDVVARGRGEDLAVAIAERLRAGASLAGLPGVAWRDADGRLHAGLEPAPLRELDPVLPAYELIERPQAYIASQGLVNYFSSYGCPHRCGFCGIPVATRTFRPRANEVVIEHLRELRSCGFHTVLFFDDNFFTSKARVLDLARRIAAAELGLSWYCNGRVDQVLAFDDAELSELVRAGLRSINIGYETGVQRVADAAQKDIQVGDIYELAARFRRVGLHLSLNFMVGLPEETPEELHASLDTLHRIHALQPNLDVSWYLFLPPPGTASYERLIRDGVLARPRTLREHMRLDTLHLELPWYGPRTRRDVLREWRGRSKAIAWAFWVAWVAPRPPGLRGLAFDGLRRLSRWRLARRAFRLRLEHRLFTLLFRVRTAARFAWCAWRRTRLGEVLRLRARSSAPGPRPSYAPLRSMHGST
ncbi:MAG: B12-binding domain-containing radical SAM protein [Planctomycetes bacterium]|nr:B12-binding domain-containing radical SAM protein [Planctomycetota bacterium]